MNEKISVIIPVYNTEKYLEKCLQSVLNQTYKNLEIICVNDGSTDGSGDILDVFAEKDTRIKVIHKENEGVSAARNDALRIATGDWIGFVDSDDSIAEEMYETMMRANSGKEADIVSCGYYMEYKDRCIPATNEKMVPNDVIRTKSFLKYIYERDMYKGVASYLCTRLIARDLLYTENGELKYTFSKEFDVSEDLVFFAEVVNDSRASLYIEKPMYYYLQRENSACHDERRQLSSLSWVRAYLRIIEILEKNNVDEDVYNLVIRMLVFRCGRFMEIAIEFHEKEAYDWLKEIVKKYYTIYKKANVQYPQRIEWLIGILDYEWD